LLPEVLKSEGTSSDEFLVICREVRAEGNEYSDGAMIINLMLATTEYDTFLTMMRDEGREAKQRMEGKVDRYKNK
jgi:hypothetical protein